MKTPPDLGSRTVAMHACFVRLTGLDLALDHKRRSAWRQWLRRGWGERQLEGVVAYIRRGIRTKQRVPTALKFTYLVENTGNFEEQLLLARDAARRGAKRGRAVVPTEVRSPDGTARLVAPEEIPTADAVHIRGLLATVQAALRPQP